MFKIRYRAPELLLSVKELSYTTAVDVWSIGCILAEMLLRTPFLKGTDTKNQLDLIFNAIGTPTEEEIKLIEGDEGKYFVSKQKKKKG